jgi:RimJ/RimL family protein N-acetyltransferase
MIKGKKVVLRKVKTGDLPLLHKWINYPSVKRFWHGRDKTRSKDWIERHFTPIISGKSDSSCWVIEVVNKPIGLMYNTPGKSDGNEFNGRIELDILIGEVEEWGKGYGTDALQAMINFIFEKQRAERVFLTPYVSNDRAIHLYQKVGFQKEGILRHFEKFEGKFVDCIMMSIIKEDFKKL